MILYLQVGFEFIYELKVKDTATFCPFWDAMPKVQAWTSQFTVLLCFNTVEKYLINLQLRLPSAGFQNIVWYTNVVIKIVYTVQ